MAPLSAVVLVDFNSFFWPSHAAAILEKWLGPKSGEWASLAFSTPTVPFIFPYPLPSNPDTSLSKTSCKNAKTFSKQKRLDESKISTEWFAEK